MSAETPHRSFAERVAAAAKADPRFIGVLAGGSFCQGGIDQYSDLDLVLIVEDRAHPQVMRERRKFAESIALPLHTFTGEHVGEPRLIICLYADPLLHVDLKFVTLDDLDQRVEEPLLIWHRDQRIPERLKQRTPKWPSRDPEWFEERFWVWVHYTAAKLGRGELLEAHDALAHIRRLVLGPMAMRRMGEEQRGMRRLEMLAPEISRQLTETLGDHSRERCVSALLRTIALYVELRNDAFPTNYNEAAEHRVRQYVDRIAAGATP